MRWLVIAGVGALVAGSFLLWPGIGKELFPDVDAGTFELRVKTVPGTRLELTEKLVERLENTIKEVIPEGGDRDDHLEHRSSGRQGCRFLDRAQLQFRPGYGLPDRQSEAIGTQHEHAEYVERLRSLLKQDYPDEQFLFVSGGIVNAALNEGVPVRRSASRCRPGRSGSAARRPSKWSRRSGTSRAPSTCRSPSRSTIRSSTSRWTARGPNSSGWTSNRWPKTILTALGSSVGYAPTIWVDPKTGIDFFMGVQYETNEIEVVGRDPKHPPVAPRQGRSDHDSPVQRGHDPAREHTGRGGPLQHRAGERRLRERVEPRRRLRGRGRRKGPGRIARGVGCVEGRSAGR